MHEERNTRQKASENNSEHPVPQYMLDRENQMRAKVLSNTIKQKRKEKAVIILFQCLIQHCCDCFHANYMHELSAAVVA
jgi:hypothetical protein